ncbi:MAG: SLBB domain-containing protein [Pseudobutyrivibrio sp.]|nr:SLBB domain-containing protein [Pseudobutyrivibrio sp.]
MNIDELKEIFRENGIVGAGGAGFPTYGKLSDKIEIILVNCAECEPLLKLHRQLLRDEAVSIVKAVSKVAEVVGAKEIVFAIKGEYETTIEAVEFALKDYASKSAKTRIHKLASAYPMGDEVVTIYEATGRQVRPGGLPIEQGVAVFNVETLYNAYKAIFEGEPVYSKCVSIVGEVEEATTVRVPIGMSIKDAVSLAGKVTCSNPVYLIGGPMMGSFKSELAPITKTTNAIIVLDKNHPLVLKKKQNFKVSLARAASSCCQCQTCTDLCPRHNLGHPIQPHLFMRFAANKDFQSIEPFLNTMFCSSCGVCEMYACPQGLQPRSMMAEYKAGLRKAGVKAPTVEAKAVQDSREYRKVPENRLEMRLGIHKYNKPAVLNNELQFANTVRIELSQHIGAPAKAVVEAGHYVKAGDVVAKAADGLSVNIHASIEGQVTEVTEKFIIIKR